MSEEIQAFGYVSFTALKIENQSGFCCEKLEKDIYFEARTILFSVRTKAKRAEDVVRDQDSYKKRYKKLERLEDLALITVDKRDFSDHGRITKFYKNRTSEAQISIKKTKPSLTLFKN